MITGGPSWGEELDALIVRADALIQTGDRARKAEAARLQRELWEMEQRRFPASPSPDVFFDVAYARTQNARIRATVATLQAAIIQVQTT